MIEDHPLREALVQELHARPFLRLTAPCEVAFLAFKEPVDAANRDRVRDLDHLMALLDHHGLPRPERVEGHLAATAGGTALKWESHSEFVTCMAVCEGAPAMAAFPEGWQAEAPGRRLCAVRMRVEPMPGPEVLAAVLRDGFEPESLACAEVLDGAAVVAGDFRLDAAGHMSFAVFVREGTGPGRIGRIVQGLCEVETYRAMAMLGLGRAREMAGRLNGIEARLTDLIGAMGAEGAELRLRELLEISTEIEAMAMRFSYRAGATAAYEAIVADRIAALREARLGGRQTLAEFMRRRFDPAMRTVKSVESRLNRIVARAKRAGELLRTRVEVDRSAQNQELLQSMDRRADMQLRLQTTVEGLSVVAISYYAVSLAAYLTHPLAERVGWSKTAVTSALVVPVIVAVWLMVRRIRRRMH